MLVKAILVLVPAAGPLRASLVASLLSLRTLQAIGSASLANWHFFAGGFWDLASSRRIELGLPDDITCRKLKAVLDIALAAKANAHTALTD